MTDIDTIQQMVIVDALRDAASLWEQQAASLPDRRPAATRREMARDARALAQRIVLAERVVLEP